MVNAPALLVAVATTGSPAMIAWTLVAILTLVIVAGVPLVDRVTRRERKRLKQQALRVIGEMVGPELAVQIGEQLGWIDVEVTAKSTRFRIR